MLTINEEFLDPRYGTRNSHVQGTINSVTTTSMSGGKMLAVFDILDSVTREIHKVAVYDPKILKKVGVGNSKDSAPPHGLLVNFQVDPTEIDGVIIGKTMEEPKIMLSRGEALRADGRNIIPAVVRTGLRIGLRDLQSVANSMADQADKQTRGYLDNLNTSWGYYIEVMERRLGSDSERDAMKKVLNDLIDVFSQMKRSGGIPQNDEKSMVSRMEFRAKELLFGLREARNEAKYDDEILISKSKAVELIAPDGSQFRKEMSATILWAAHNTIKSEDKSGTMGSELESIQSALIRYRKDVTGGYKDLAVGLKRAGKVLTDMKARAANDPILVSSLDAAFRNVKEAYRWISTDQTSLEERVDLECKLVDRLRQDCINDTRMQTFAEIVIQEEVSGNSVLRELKDFENKPNIRRAVEFSDGEILQIDKSGNIVMHDREKMLALVDSPGQGRRYFVDGKIEGCPERVREETASLAYETPSSQQFAA